MQSLRDIRIEKMADLPQLYPNARVMPSHPKRAIAMLLREETLQSYIDDAVSLQVKGRVYSKRGSGKITFLDVYDQSGKIQVFLEVATLGEEVYVNIRETLDLGDIVEAEGVLFVTPRGEITLKAHSFAILSKCVAPPPIGKTHDGEHSFALADVELLQRKRYLQFISTPESKNVFIQRSAIISEIRRYFDHLDFIEVETPILQPLRGGATAKPFETHHNALDEDMYLRIAPELYLKRLLVGGFERIFEIGRNFRNEGIDTSHNPEFTMLEAYWAYANYEDTMSMVESLVNHLCENFGENRQRFGMFPRITYFEAFDQLIDSVRTDDEGWQEIPGNFEQLFALPNDERLMRIRFLAEYLEVAVDENDGFIQIVDLIFKKRIVKGNLFNGKPFFVMDYPVEVSPLAKAREDNPELVERYQLIWNGLEVANGYSELADPFVQRERFENQAVKASEGDEEAMPIDEDFIEALEFAMPPSSGFGVGLDRIVAILLGKENIRDIIIFPTLKQEK